MSSDNEKRANASKEGQPTEAKYPKSIIFIIANEFCERFTYYGLRTVLTLYLLQQLKFDDDVGINIYHTFIMLCYFTPLFGAIIADSWLGKFWTIFYLSIVYALGSITLSIGSFPLELDTMRAVSFLGLFMIGVGTGGIKPCVSAFGGDQFQKGQEVQLQRFFSFFYISINVGSLISTYVTPIFREDVHCMGQKTCFPVAFGVPSILMIVAIIFFVAGRSFYTMKPPEGNIVVKVSKCICHAIAQKCKSKEKKKSHWLDYAEDKFDKKLINEIKILLRIFVLYIPLPIFWTLFDQSSSRWIIQATKLDGLVGSFHIKADQMNVVNPLLIVCLIPLFDYCVYPLLKKCNLLTKALHRMALGLFLAAVSFVIAGMLEYKLEESLPVLPSPGMTQITIINNSPCSVKIQGGNISVITSHSFESVIADVVKDEPLKWKFTSEDCSISAEPYELSFTPNFNIESMMITIDNKQIKVIQIEDNKTKSAEGNARIRFFFNINSPKSENMRFKFAKEASDETFHVKSNNTESFGVTEYKDISPGRYKVYALLENDEDNLVLEMDFKSGGIYIVSIYNMTNENAKTVKVYEMVKGNSISILLQIPQYTVLTISEILFSISGLEFSYNQAPNSMKSVIQSVWLLTVAVGNVVVIVVKSFKSEKVSNELFLFAGLMAGFTIVFFFLASRYKYVTHEDNNEPVETTSSPSGKSNDAYVEETDFNK